MMSRPIFALALAASLLSACKEAQAVVTISGEIVREGAFTKTPIHSRLKTTGCDFAKEPVCTIRSARGNVVLTWLPQTDNFSVAMGIPPHIIEPHSDRFTLDQLKEGVELTTVNWTRKGNNSFVFPAKTFVLHLTATDAGE
jgi:hypothetical protein